MNENLDANPLNKISLKPRFKIERSEGKTIIIEKFEHEFAHGSGKFIGKIVDHHIVIDVPTNEAHFWSPHLHAEISEHNENETTIKGLFGPKPSVWSLFMFIHFGVAIGFMVFLVMLYTRWSLQQEYHFAMIMCIAMPVLWFVLYFLGRIGRKKGSKQMDELRAYFLEILEQ